jgi:hypothetical protein
MALGCGMAQGCGIALGCGMAIRCGMAQLAEGASAGCKAGPSSILGSAPQEGSFLNAMRIQDDGPRRMGLG